MHKEERDVLEMDNKDEECGMEKFGTQNSSGETIAVVA